MIHGGFVDLVGVLKWRKHMAEDDAEARERRVFNHSRCGFATLEELSLCSNSRSTSLSNGYEDVYEETLNWGRSKRLRGAFPLKLSPHASRLVLPFLLKSLSIPRP